MKKIISGFLGLVLVTVGVTGTAFAQTPSVTLTPSITTTPRKDQIKEKIKELREENKNNRENFKEETKENRNEFKFDLKNLIGLSKKTNKGSQARIINAQVSTVSANSLTVSKDGKSYTVNILVNTTVRRHYWGKSSLSEFSVGDKVNIWGVWTDDTKTTVDAKLIRDLSIMKRFGVFIGNVSSKDSASFVIKSLNRGDQTIFIDSKTKFVNRKEESISFSNLNMGDRVRVKGLWDKASNKVTDVVQVKDFFLPTKSGTEVSPSISPSTSPVLSPSVSPTKIPSSTPTP